jgi:hypothetical protein
MFGEAARPQPSPKNSRDDVDRISIIRRSYDGENPEGHRVWTVLVKMNDDDVVERTLTDPFTEKDYSPYMPSGVLGAQRKPPKSYVELLCNDVRQQALSAKQIKS